MNIFIKKMIKKTLFFLANAALIFFIPFIYFIFKRFNIKFCMINNSRIGHFSINSEYAISYSYNKKIKCIYYLSQKNSCNVYLENLIKKKCFYLNRALSELILNQLNLYKKLVSKDLYFFSLNIYLERDTNNFLDNFNKNIFIEKKVILSKNRKFDSILEKKFVTLHVRDKNYLKNRFKDKDYSIHDCRDSDISTYKKSIENLISRGYGVIKVGDKSSNRLNLEDPKYFDYACSEFKSDKLDIEILNNSSFAIGTESGGTMLSHITLRKPTLCLNYTHIGQIHSSQSYVWYIHKKLKNIKTQKYLSLNDIFSQNFAYFLNDYQSKGLELIDNTEDEIDDAVNEFIDFQENKINLDKILLYNKKYKKKFLENHRKYFDHCINAFFKNQKLDKNEIKFHGNFESNIASIFLERNEFLWQD